MIMTFGAFFGSGFLTHFPGDPALDLRCDESGMTGESDAIKKEVEKDPFLLSGTKVGPLPELF